MNSIVETILIRFGFQYRTISAGSKFLMKCPFHKDSHSSFTIRSDTGLYGCFSCGATGPDIKHFLKRLKGEDVELRDFISEVDEVRIRIQKVYSKSINTILQIEDYSDFVTVHSFISQDFIPALEHEESKKYLTGEKRKLTEDTIEKFKLQYAISGKYEQRVIIPYYKNGRIIGFNSRLIGVDKSFGKEDRYRYLISNNQFEEFLYNYENIENKKYCILVEGPFDLMYLVQCGYKNVISTLNTRVSNQHLMKILEFDKIIFCFDNDEKRTGEKSMMKAANHILSIVPTKQVLCVKLPDFKDPNECTPEELESAFRSLKSIRLKNLENSC